MMTTLNLLKQDKFYYQSTNDGMTDELISLISKVLDEHKGWNFTIDIKFDKLEVR